MELQDASTQLPEAVKRQYPLEIYDHGKLVAVAYPPEYREKAAKRLMDLMDEIGREIQPISREEMKELLEIDDEEYDNLGLGQ